MRYKYIFWLESAKRIFSAIGCASLFFACSVAVSDNQGQDPNQSLSKSEAPVASEAYEPLVPQFIGNCLDHNSWLPKEISIPARPKYNPYFVRGDFDGDGGADYAVIVENRSTAQEGLLVCFRKTKSNAILLGLDRDKPPPFWRLEDLDVMTAKEINDNYDFQGRSVTIKPKGESIVMNWEDAMGLIYWDGKQFRWREVILNSSR